MAGSGSRWFAGRILIAAALTICAGSVRADVGPPVRIRMPVDSPVAQTGQLYTGVFEVDVARPGTVEGVRVGARGWRTVDVDVSAVNGAAAAGTLRIPFQAIPDDADQPITLALTFDRRSVSRSFRLGPQAAIERNKGRPSVQVRPGAPAPPRDGQSLSNTAGDSITLRFTGRVVYDRPESLDDDGNPRLPETQEGVHGIRVEVMDEDDISDETVWSGLTDKDGYFDSGDFQWDDCDDFGCDDPDLYLVFTTDNHVVDIINASVPGDFRYFWSSADAVVEDFEGNFYDFGWVKPLLYTDMPVLHIHNSIYRARLYIEFKSGGGYIVPEVDVLFPDGDNAFYSPGSETIHVSLFRRWHEATHTHEYGHHFLENFAANVSPDYCNDICDDDGCSHCIWCEETDHDAWNEGWPNWLADVVTRDYPIEYTFTNGDPYTALVGRSQETTQPCHLDDEFHNALITEGFIGALLADIDDDAQDSRNVSTKVLNVVERTDCLALGPEEIFTVTVAAAPTTPAGFVEWFRLFYPQHASAFYTTAFYIAPEYAALFPSGSTDPGTVASATSTSHPAGKGNPLPCISVDWDTPPDSQRGANRYEIAWSTDPDGAEPNMFSPDVFGSCVTVVDGPFRVGSHYLSIRAQGWDDHWRGHAVFGPFTVTDCNGNGKTDLCEIACDASSYSKDLGCSIPSSFCAVEADCGTAQDCQPNLVPDDCDIAGGHSSDCNENEIPDECENISHWEGASGPWSDGANWREGSPPVDGNDVCIGVFPDQITATFNSGILDIGILSCDENLTVAAAANQSPQLTLVEPSWVHGNVALRNSNTVLRVDDRLDIDGLFTWTGSNSVFSAKLKGAGATHAYGGLLIPSSVVHLDNHDLILESNTTSTSLGRIDYVGAATITVRPGATFDHQSDSSIINGGTSSSFINEGRFIKSVSTARLGISAPVQNSGLIHVRAGTLYLSGDSTTTGGILADPGTTMEFVCGGHEFAPGSTIVAENVLFSGGNCGESFIRGEYNVTTSTTQAGGSPVTFTSEATIVSYGADLEITGGAPVIFDAVVGSTVHFNSIVGGTARFNGGDPIVTETLTLQSNGVISGPGPITVNGLLTWKAGTIFRGPGVLHSNGQLTVAAGGAQKTLDDRTLNIVGLAVFNGQFALTNGASVNNLTAGVVDIRVDGNIMTGGGNILDNAGTIVKTSGSETSTVILTIFNTGLIESRTGTLEVRRLTQTAGEILLNGGDFAMYQISTPQPLELMGGQLRGNGTVTGVVNHTGGVVSPGLSAGGLTVNGTYTQGTGGTLRIEIGGRVPGTEFDQLIVTGTAKVGGALEVEFIDGFVPLADDTFLILTALVRNGLFTRLDYEGLPSHLGLTFTPSPTSIQVDIFERPPPEGDCNHSESIDLSDFLVLHGCLSGPLGPNPSPIASQCRCIDMDLDDDVDLADLAAFQNAFSP